MVGLGVVGWWGWGQWGDGGVGGSRVVGLGRNNGLFKSSHFLVLKRINCFMCDLFSVVEGCFEKM